jgi:hypothetical protein
MKIPRKKTRKERKISITEKIEYKQKREKESWRKEKEENNKEI